MKTREDVPHKQPASIYQLPFHLFPRRSRPFHLDEPVTVKEEEKN